MQLRVQSLETLKCFGELMIYKKIKSIIHLRKTFEHSLNMKNIPSSVTSLNDIIFIYIKYPYMSNGKI